MPSSKMNGLIRLRAPIAVDVLVPILSICLDHERWCHCLGFANLRFQGRVKDDLQYYRIQVWGLKHTGAGSRVTANIERCLSITFTLLFSYF